jgi:hypothetical protein
MTNGVYSLAICSLLVISGIIAYGLLEIACAIADIMYWRKNK